MTNTAITEADIHLIQRIIQSGEKNERIRIRKVDKRRFDKEAAIILAILNDAWGDLADTDSWQNKYFDNKNDASRDSFFFFTPP